MESETDVKTAETRMARDMMTENAQLRRVIAEYMRRDVERDKLYFADIEVRRGRRVVFIV